MLPRAFVIVVLAAWLAMPACKVNQGNGEAQPENTGSGANPDNQKNDVRQGGTGGSKSADTAANPAKSQTPGQPASRTDSSH